MGFLNKFLAILIVPMIASIGLIAFESYAPANLRPSQNLGLVLETYRDRLQNPLGSREKSESINPKDYDLATLAKLAKESKDRDVANSNLDKALDEIFEDDGIYDINEPPPPVPETAAIEAEQPPAAVEPEKPKTIEIVLDGTKGFVPPVEEDIMKLNVPESVRQEILRQYRKTGALPVVNSGLLETSRRSPAAAN